VTTTVKKSGSNAIKLCEVHQAGAPNRPTESCSLGGNWKPRQYLAQTLKSPDSIECNVNDGAEAPHASRSGSPHLEVAEIIVGAAPGRRSRLPAAQPGNIGPGLGWQLVNGGGEGTFLNLGGFISAIVYFVVFMAVVYFLIVLPYKAVMARQGKTVFGDPPPTKTCPACLSDDLNPAATRCKHCGSDIGRAAA
jgi:hypothetical protein